MIFHNDNCEITETVVRHEARPKATLYDRMRSFSLLVRIDRWAERDAPSRVLYALTNMAKGYDEDWSAELRDRSIIEGRDIQQALGEREIIKAFLTDGFGSHG